MTRKDQSLESETGEDPKSVVSGSIKGQSSEQPGARVMADPRDIEEIYVDGVAGMSLRAGVAKIDCYRVVGQQQSEEGVGQEVRRVAHRLVMPALALNELAQILQRTQEATRYRPS